MKIDRALNLVLPVDTSRGTIYVHSTPIGKDIFEQYFMPISMALSEIYRTRTMGMGPRTAALMLRRCAEETGDWDDSEIIEKGKPVVRYGVENGLMAEIRRLTNIVFPRPNGAGWSTLSLELAQAQDIIDAGDVSEVENAVVFFICASAIFKGDRLLSAMSQMVSFWGARLESSNSTEFAASLRTSTAGATSPKAKDDDPPKPGDAAGDQPEKAWSPPV